MDWQNLGAQAILALIPVVSMVLTWVVRQLVPKIPRIALPVIAVALGFVVTAVQNYMGGVGVTVVETAALGAAATWLNEMITTFKEHKVNP